MKEIWKDIKGYEGYYQVSNLGQVKSLNRIIKYIWHNVSDIHKHEGKIIAQNTKHYGCIYVQLWKNNKGKRKYLHQLIARHFIPNPNNYNCINHINGIKIDNRIENLEWCTLSYNTKQAYATGLMSHINHNGEKNPSAKLKKEEVLKIKQQLKNYYKGIIQKLAKEYNVHCDTIRNIQKNKKWKSILI